MMTVRGFRPVLEALRAQPLRVKKVVIYGAVVAKKLEIEHLARRLNVPVYRESREAGTSGVLAQLSTFQWADFDELLESATSPALFLVLDQVSDPRNFGAIVRAADGAGVHGIVIHERKMAPPSEVAVVASAGALLHSRVARVRNISDALSRFKQVGVWTVGLQPTAKQLWNSFDYSEPVAIVLGSEGRGLRQHVANTCDTLVSLPQNGTVESLNISVAAGVVLYEIVRQRMENK